MKHRRARKRIRQVTSVCHFAFARYDSYRALLPGRIVVVLSRTIPCRNFDHGQNVAYIPLAGMLSSYLSAASLALTERLQCVEGLRRRAWHWRF